ncbi:Exportin-6, partial [Blyttiomyces sp. JEL0837]
MSNVEILCRLVQDFFTDPSTSSARKKEIEQILESFKSQPNAYQTCQEILTETDRPGVVKWFCLSVLESFIVNHRPMLTVEQRHDNRQFVWNYMVSESSKLEKFVCNKLIKVVVDLGKADYPREWPEFFDNVFHLKSVSFVLMLAILENATDEFMSRQNRLGSMKQRELRMAMTERAPHIISLCIMVLNSVIEMAGASGPFLSSADSASSISIGLHSPTRHNDFWRLPSVGDSPSRNSIGEDLDGSGILYQNVQITGENAAACEYCLNTLHHFLAWIPLTNEFYIQSILEILVKFIRTFDNLSLLAFVALNEILSRKHIPQDCSEMLMSASWKVCEVIRFVTSEGKSDDILEGLYKIKIIDFLESFVSMHVNRAEVSSQFSLSQFLLIFYEFTFTQNSLEHLMRCLHIWDVFLDSLLDQKKETNQSQDMRYREGICGVGQAVINKMTLKSRDDLDNLAYDGDDTLDVAWEKVSDLSIIDLYPMEFLPSLCSFWLSLSEYVQSAPTEIGFQNVAISCRMLGQGCHIFTTEFQANMPTVKYILEHMLALLKWSIQACNRGLPAIKFRLLEDNPVDNDNGFFSKLIVDVIESCLQALSIKSDDVSLSATNLFLSITRTVRPVNLLKTQITQDFLTEISKYISMVCPAAQRNLYQTAAGILILPRNSAKAPDQEWNQRTSNFSAFANHVILNPLLSAMEVQEQNLSPKLADARSTILKEMLASNAVISFVAEESTNAREIVYSALKPIMPKVLNLFNLYAQDFEMLASLLEYITALFGSFRKQILRENVSLIVQAVDFCAAVIGGDQVSRFALGEGGLEVLNNFLLLMSCIVEDNSKAMEGLLPTVLRVCLSGHLNTCFALKNPAVDTVKIHYYDLLFKVVLFHPRYFFGSQIKSMLHSHVADTSHDMELIRLLEIIAQSLSDPDSEVFRKNLAGLDTLNTKCSLYNKDAFVKSLRFPYLLLFIRLLLEGGHEVFTDVIVEQVVRLIHSDLESFHKNFIPVFFSTNCSQMSQEHQNVLMSHLSSIRDISDTSRIIEDFITDYSEFRLLELPDEIASLYDSAIGECPETADSSFYTSTECDGFYFELVKCPPNFDRLRQLLRTVVYEGPRFEAKADLGRRMLDMDTLKHAIQASGEEVEAWLKEMGAFEYEGCYRVIDTGLMKDFIRLLAAAADEAGEAFQRITFEQAREFTEDLQLPNEITKQCLRVISVSEQDGILYEIDSVKASRLIGLDNLRSLV